MVGISWGGINALQIAARQPPALKAVISHCSTPDRYSGDAHYKGGCVLQDQVLWGSLWLTFQALPPDPAIVGDRWETQWRTRLAALRLELASWLEHTHRDDFWKHASVAGNYADIACPVYAIGGLADPYAGGVLALLEHLTVPRKGLLGPWAHTFPHESPFQPRIDYLTESLRWWDHWLKGRDTGLLAEPMLRVWLQAEAPVAGAMQAPGRWVAERTWPPPTTWQRTLYLNDRTLGARSGHEQALVLAPDQTVGIAAGRWLRLNPALDLPLEQSVDDGRSLCFDSAPLSAALEILGQPVLELELAVDQPVAYVVARLCDLSPGGQSRRVSYACLNLCQRANDSDPQPVQPGERMRVQLPLDACAHRFAAGQRIRVAVSSSYWPLLLPAPRPVTLTVYSGRSRLELPVRPAAREDKELRSLGGAFLPPQAVDGGGNGPPRQELSWDLQTGEQTLTRQGGGWTRLLQTGTTLERSIGATMSINQRDPAGALAEYRIEFGLKRDGWAPRVSTVTRIELTGDAFVLSATLVARQGDSVVTERSFSHRIARRLV